MKSPCWERFFSLLRLALFDKHVKERCPNLPKEDRPRAKRRQYTLADAFSYVLEWNSYVSRSELPPKKAAAKFRKKKKVQLQQERRFFQKVLFYCDNPPCQGEIMKTKAAVSSGSGNKTSILTPEKEAHFAALVVVCRGPPAPQQTPKTAKVDEMREIARAGLGKSENLSGTDSLENIFGEEEEKASEICMGVPVPAPTSPPPRKRKRREVVDLTADSDEDHPVLRPAAKRRPPPAPLSFRNSEQHRLPLKAPTDAAEWGKPVPRKREVEQILSDFFSSQRPIILDSESDDEPQPPPQAVAEYDESVQTQGKVENPTDKFDWIYEANVELDESRDLKLGNEM